jgi:hypothetical protein
VIAIGLLLIYHTAIAFQPWGIMIGFITTETPWVSLWTPMTLINIWRIPLLFFVSGMGVYFAIQNRNWKQLLQERATRIMLPFLFGMFVLVPVGTFLWQYYYGWDISYSFNPGHLWFLWNIFIYVVILCPLFFYLNKNKEGKIGNAIKKILATPLGLLPVFTIFIAEAEILDPRPFELYATTIHGFVIGLLAFLVGFCYAIGSNAFWQMTSKWRWMFLVMAVALYAARMTQFQPNAPNFLLAIESNCWIITVFGFASRYLNRPSNTLAYLSQAAYPIYILHMIFLYLGAYVIFPLEIVVQIKFGALLLFTLVGCLITYEFFVRRVHWIRPLFGLKVKCISPIDAVASQGDLQKS